MVVLWEGQFACVTKDSRELFERPNFEPKVQQFKPYEGQEIFLPELDNHRIGRPENIPVDLAWFCDIQVPLSKYQSGIKGEMQFAINYGNC